MLKNEKKISIISFASCLSFEQCHDKTHISVLYSL